MVHISLNIDPRAFSSQCHNLLKKGVIRHFWTKIAFSKDQRSISCLLLFLSENFTCNSILTFSHSNNKEASGRGPKQRPGKPKHRPENSFDSQKTQQLAKSKKKKHFQKMVHISLNIDARALSSECGNLLEKGVLRHFWTKIAFPKDQPGISALRLIP